MENKNTDDIDLFIDIVNENHEKKLEEEIKKQKQQEHFNKILKEAFKKSTTDNVIYYNPRQVNRPLGVKKILNNTLAIMLASITITLNTASLASQFKGKIEATNISNSLGEVVKDNTNYYGYNPNRNEFYWEYSFGDMAHQILETNLEYDIDTRIYGCYHKMSEWQKKEHMDELFRTLNSVVNKGEYDEKTKASCSFPTFNEYLNSLGLTETEYQDYMKKILNAYGYNNISEVEELLNNLHGGSR